jgi:hypothetical protein
MSRDRALAERLRQAVQGCTIHNHGPVQAWAAARQACLEGRADEKEVARLAVEACTGRIEELKKAGASADDLRIKKEELTRAFIERLFPRGE